MKVYILIENHNLYDCKILAVYRKEIDAINDKKQDTGDLTIEEHEVIE